MHEQLSVKAVIANNIKKYRKLNNMTQAKLAEEADVSNTYIANIECGHTWISDKTLENIAKALHIDIYLLFIPDINEKSFANSTEKQQETITYLNKRKNELEKYIKDFFSETFYQILNNK